MRKIGSRRQAEKNRYTVARLTCGHHRRRRRRRRCCRRRRRRLNDGLVCSQPRSRTKSAVGRRRAELKCLELLACRSFTARCLRVTRLGYFRAVECRRRLRRRRRRSAFDKTFSERPIGRQPSPSLVRIAARVARRSFFSDSVKKSRRRLDTNEQQKKRRRHTNEEPRRSHVYARRLASGEIGCSCNQLRKSSVCSSSGSERARARVALRVKAVYKRRALYSVNFKL